MSHFARRLQTASTTTSSPPPPPPPGGPRQSTFITAAEALTLPKSGAGYTNATGIASSLKAGSFTPDLDNVDTRAGSIALVSAIVWLNGNKTDNALLTALKSFILAAPGTDPSTTQALNPMRAIGGLLSAVDILDAAGVWNMNASCPNNGGSSFQSWLNGLENRVVGTVNARWQTISGTASDSANNWGSVARYAQLMIGVTRGDAALVTQTVNLMQRYFGDTTKAAAFNTTSDYIASWDNTGGASGKVNSGIGFADPTHPGLDGVVVDDVNRGGTGYSASADFFGATGKGLTYPLEAAEYVWASAAVMIHLGYNVTSWANQGLLRMGDWFNRAQDSSGVSNYRFAEAEFSIYKNHRWYSSRLKGGTPYGTPQPTSSGTGGMARVLPHGDWLCGPGSQWLL